MQEIHSILNAAYSQYCSNLEKLAFHAAYECEGQAHRTIRRTVEVMNEWQPKKVTPREEHIPHSAAISGMAPKSKREQKSVQYNVQPFFREYEYKGQQDK